MSVGLTVYYTTYDDVRRQFPKLMEATSVDSGQVAKAIGEVDAIINARISGLYSVPISPAPPLLQVVSTDLSVGRLLRRTGQLMSGDKSSREDIMERFTSANSMLADIASGKIPLLTSAGAQIDQLSGSGVWYNNANYVPTFDVGPMEEQEVDPDRIDDIEAARY